jgi:hypothetical protein
MSTCGEDNLLLSFPKDLVTRFIPLLGCPFLTQIGQDPSNFRKILNEVAVVIGYAKQ